MSLISPFIKQTVATILVPSINAYGDSTYTATLQDTSTSDYSIKCRFVVTPKYLYSSVGVAEIAKAQMWVEPATVINEGYKLSHGGKEYEVVSVEEKVNLEGSVEFKKVLLR